MVEEYASVPGYLRIGPEPERRIRLTDRGYTLLRPAGTDKSKGVVVFVDPGRFDTAAFFDVTGGFDAQALSQGLSVLHISTGNPLEFLLDEGALDDVTRRVVAILKRQGLASAPLFLAGMSLGGTRALKLTIFLQRHRGRYSIEPAAVAVVDAPLDMTRMWNAMRRAGEARFHPAAADEGRWVRYMLETNLGGTPGEVPDRYVSYSPYAHSAPDAGNAVHLRDVAVGAYHEPDVNWWIENRRKSYYDMNSIDLAALINTLRLHGNERAELITTHRRREGFAGGSSPHTWSIVDETDLVDWFLAQAKPRR